MNLKFDDQNFLGTFTEDIYFTFYSLSKVTIFIEFFILFLEAASQWDRTQI